MIRDLHFPLDLKIYQLSDGHTQINLYWLMNGYLHNPMVAIADITFARGGMNIDTEPTNTGFTFQKWHIVMSFGVFSGNPKINSVRLENKSIVGNINVFHPIMFFRIENPILIDGKGIS